MSLGSILRVCTTRDDDPPKYEDPPTAVRAIVNFSLRALAAASFVLVVTAALEKYWILAGALATLAVFLMAPSVPFRHTFASHMASALVCIISACISLKYNMVGVPLISTMLICILVRKAAHMRYWLFINLFFSLLGTWACSAQKGMTYTQWALLASQTFCFFVYALYLTVTRHANEALEQILERNKFALDGAEATIAALREELALSKTKETGGNLRRVPTMVHNNSHDRLTKTPSSEVLTSSEVSDVEDSESPQVSQKEVSDAIKRALTTAEMQMPLCPPSINGAPTTLRRFQSLPTIKRQLGIPSLDPQLGSHSGIPSLEATPPVTPPKPSLWAPFAACAESEVKTIKRQLSSIPSSESVLDPSPPLWVPFGAYAERE